MAWRTIKARRVHYVDYGRDVILCDRFHRGAVTLVADVTEIDGMADVNAWQPIETTPKARDERILVHCKNGATYAVYWSTICDAKAGFEPCWCTIGGNELGELNRDARQPTHWMPLPAPPQSDDAQGGRGDE